MIKKTLPLLLVLILSYWSIKPLLQPGFFPIHDDTQVVRVQQMAEALRDGQFPVRWVKDLGYGYGYPIYNFYAPLPYYVGAFFNLLGLDALRATKLMMIIGVLLAGIFMYFLAKEFWGTWGGLISALFYVYAPYHALDIYVRGAVGEFYAIALLPLVFLGIYRIYQGRGFLLASLGFTSVILSHNLTAIMVLPLLFLAGAVIFILSKDKKSIVLLFYCSIVLLSLGLSAFYWLPALWEKNLTKINQMIDQTKTWEHLVYWDQFWTSLWGFAGSAPGRLDGMSFMIGKLHVIFSVLSLIVVLRLWSKKKKLSIIILFSVFCFLFSVFLASQSSLFVWRNLRSLDVLQYPWRFLIFITLAASFMAGSIILWFKKNAQLTSVATGLIILVLLIFNNKFFHPQDYLSVKEADYLKEESVKWYASKISDEYLPKNFPVPGNKEVVAWEKVEVLDGEAEIRELTLKSHQTRFNVDARTETEILINTAYYPGWKIWVNGEETYFSLDNGKIKLSLPKGQYQVLIRFTNTPIRTLANLISLVSWIGLLGFVLQYYSCKRLIWRR